jgi:hypothetical protein
MNNYAEKITSSEEQRYGRNKLTLVNLTYIESNEYRRKFDKITENSEINRLLYQKAKEILKHRSGTEFEDLVFVNSITGEVLENTNFAEIESDNKYKVKPTDQMKRMVKNSPPNTVVALHNHPKSSVPSMNDLHSAFYADYKFGLIICHSGDIYKYIVGDYFSPLIADWGLAHFETAYKLNDVLGLHRAKSELLDADVVLEVL